MSEASHLKEILWAQANPDEDDDENPDRIDCVAILQRIIRERDDALKGLAKLAARLPEIEI